MAGQIPKIAIKHLQLDASRALWEVVFDEDTPSFLDYYYQYKAAKNEIDIDDNETDGTGGLPEKGGMLEKTGMPDTTGRPETAVSMVHWNPYMLHIGSRKPGKGIRPGTDTITDGDRDGGPEGEDNRDETSVPEIGAEGVRVPYIVGVATLPEYRHQGRMARLLREGLRREARRGTPFVWLIPADGAIYEPFSFRYVGKKYIVVWDEEEQGESDRNTAGQYLTGQGGADRDAVGQPIADQGFVIEELSEADDVRVSSFLNDRLRELCDVFAVRSRAYIADARAQFSSDGGGVAVIKHRDDIEGYFSWWPEDGILKIREMVLSRRLEKLEGDAQEEKRLGPVKDSPIKASPIEESLRSFFYAIGEERNSEELKALSRGRIEAVTTGWTGAPVSCMPQQNVMFRVADVRSFLELFRSKTPYHIHIRVTDDIVEENNRIFDWTVDADGAKAEPFSEEESALAEEETELDGAGDELDRAGGGIDKAIYSLDESGNGLDGARCDVEAAPEELIAWLFTDDIPFETHRPTDARGPIGGGGHLSEREQNPYPELQKYARIHLPECV